MADLLLGLRARVPGGESSATVRRARSQSIVVTRPSSVKRISRRRFAALGSDVGERGSAGGRPRSKVTRKASSPANAGRTTTRIVSRNVNGSTSGFATA